MQILVKGQDTHREANIAGQAENMFSGECVDAAAVLVLNPHVNGIPVPYVAGAVQHAVIELHLDVFRPQAAQNDARMNIRPAAYLHIAIADVHIQYLDFVPHLLQILSPIHESLLSPQSCLRSSPG